jgi:hypothetical protein
MNTYQLSCIRKTTLKSKNKKSVPLFWIDAIIKQIKLKNLFYKNWFVN